MDTTKIMSVKEAAEYLRMDYFALVAHIRRGNLNADKFGASYVLLRTDVEEFRNKRAGGQFVR